MTRKKACIIVAAVAAVLVGLILASDLKAASEPLPPIEYETERPEAMTAMPHVTEPIIETPVPVVALQSVGELEPVAQDEGEPLENIEQLEAPEEAPAWHVLEHCRISAYCPCELCCGAYAQDRPVDEDGNEIVYGAWGRCRDGATVAVDPEAIPYGSYVYIQNAVTGAWDEYRATDTGGGIVSYSRTTGPIVDVYYSDHAAACNHPHAAFQTVYWASEPVDVGVLA